DAVDVIRAKRDGGALSPEQIDWVIDAYTRGAVGEEQMSALAMAIFLNGMERAEIVRWTQAMIRSGERMDFSSLSRPTADKHSTGGVGDKVSLVLAPLVASLGVAVPMMSGRSLGHTGGTLDKLESIPGFRTDLSLAQARAQIERLGCVMIGQTPEIAPADKKMYALRDATATVESIPLIASSIMSKKLAEDLNGLVLDIKRGSGAFLPELERVLHLADVMIKLGADHGCPCVALVTAMDRPLGRACGNALEVEEAIAALKNEGPPDLMEVTYALGAEMLVLAGVAEDLIDARRDLERAIADGRAAERFQRIIEAQGGNPAVVDDPAVLPQAAECEIFGAPRRGFVARIEPKAIGRGIIEMGGGRTRVEDQADPTVGFVITARPGDWVEAGEPMATIFARDRAGVGSGRQALRSSVVIADEAEPPLPLISHRVTGAGAEPYRAD
ncbi:MAG TPA: thymidine phosphorylase, partial [Gemmatimonadaceae bacterium]